MGKRAEPKKKQNGAAGRDNKKGGEHREEEEPREKQKDRKGRRGARGQSADNEWGPWEQLTELGLRIRKIQPDGNCLFRAVGDQIAGDEGVHSKLREQVMDYVEAHEGEFAPFVEDDAKFHDYCRTMRKDGTWAGNIELQALSMVLERNISIHRHLSPRWLIHNFDNPRGPTIHLSYHDGEHYNSVRHAAEDQLGPANIVIGERSHERAGGTAARGGGQRGGVPPKAAVQAVMRGTGCTDMARAEQVLEEFRADVDSAVEFLIADMGSPDEHDPGSASNTKPGPQTAAAPAAASGHAQHAPPGLQRAPGNSGPTKPESAETTSSVPAVRRAVPAGDSSSKGATKGELGARLTQEGHSSSAEGLGSSSTATALKQPVSSCLGTIGRQQALGLDCAVAGLTGPGMVDPAQCCRHGEGEGPLQCSNLAPGEQETASACSSPDTAASGLGEESFETRAREVGSPEVGGAGEERPPFGAPSADDAAAGAPAGRALDQGKGAGAAVAKSSSDKRKCAGPQVHERKRHPAKEGKGLPGRNQPCPCGSKKKFKACCGTRSLAAGHNPPPESSPRAGPVLAGTEALCI